MCLGIIGLNKQGHHQEWNHICRKSVWRNFESITFIQVVHSNVCWWSETWIWRRKKKTQEPEQEYTLHHNGSWNKPWSSFIISNNTSCCTGSGVVGAYGSFPKSRSKKSTGQHSRTQKVTSGRNLYLLCKAVIIHTLKHVKERAVTT